MGAFTIERKKKGWKKSPPFGLLVVKEQLFMGYNWELASLS
jgi:hypothetical protein